MTKKKVQVREEDIVHLLADRNVVRAVVVRELLKIWLMMFGAEHAAPNFWIAIECHAVTAIVGAMDLTLDEFNDEPEGEPVDRFQTHLVFEDSYVLGEWLAQRREMAAPKRSHKKKA